MRKDVKLGLAVGGVLLAVLVVYVLVAPRSNQPGTELASADSETAAGMAQAGGATDSSATSGGEASDAATAQRGATGSPDQQAKSNGASGASGDVSGGGGGGGAGEKPSADTGWNWDALVNGEKVPSMMSPTQVPANGADNGAGTGAASGASTGGATGANNSDGGRGSNVASNSAASGAAAGSAAVGDQGAAAADGGASVASGGASGTGGGASGTAGGTLLAQGPMTDPLSDATQARSSQSPTARNIPSAAQPSGLGAQPSTRPAAGTHVVKPGETFSSIAADTYGNANLYLHIQQANPSLDPGRLKPGTTINVPALDPVKPAAGAAAAAPKVAAAEKKIDPRTQYQVKDNDSLYKISMKLYGKADRMDKLYEMNKPIIGDDMSQVKVGTILALPEPPTQSTAAAASQ